MKNLNFNRTTTSRGRNGILKTKGIEVMPTNGGQDVMLSPITKNGVSESCWIEIPKEDVQAVCSEIMKAAGIDPLEWAKQVVFDAGLLAVQRVHQS